MATLNIELNTLLDQVNDWFTTIPLDEPISQFVLDEDKVRLATISRTTLSWFKPLIDPPLTNEGINDCSDFTSSDEDHIASEDLVQTSQPLVNVPCPRKPTITKKRKLSQQKATNKKPKKKQNLKSAKEDASSILDTLVRDLELLIGDGQCDGDDKTSIVVCNEPELVFLNVYTNEEDALLDSSIGACCTINVVRDHLEQKEDLDEKKVIFTYYSDSSSQNRSADKDNTSKVQTPLPIDHDYVPRPRRVNIKPLSSNKLFVETKRTDNILNMDALKRFAKFSDKFRVLSMVDC